MTPWFTQANAQDVDLLLPEEAFAFSAEMDEEFIRITYDIADGYYLYKDRFILSQGQSKIPSSNLRFSEAKTHEDEFFGTMEIYRNHATILVSSSTIDRNNGAVLKVISQGCADIGVCYPPHTDQTTLAFASVEGFLGDEEARVDDILSNGSLPWVSAAFLVFGMLLAFTPCVLPMIPILAGILARGTPSQGRVMLLTGVYVSGLAFTYTALGVFAGLGGSVLSFTLQKPAALVTYATIMLLLSASLFGLIRIPAAITQDGIPRNSHRQSTLAGALAMGIFSSLITSACVAPPLAGTLLYISKTGDAVLGGTALFSMAIGISLPVVTAGLSTKSLIPRMGAYAVIIKGFLGYLMIAAAAWIVSPLMSIPAQMTLLGLIAAAGGLQLAWMLLRRSSRTFPIVALASLLPLVTGGIFIGGGVTGGNDLLNPLAHLGKQGHTVAVDRLNFTTLDSMKELPQTISSLKNRKAMLYFTADWCISCDELERFTFSDPKVAQQLEDLMLIKIDLSGMTPEQATLLRNYDLVGPPSMVFVNAQNRPLLKLVGYKPPERFLRALDRIRADQLRLPS